MTPHRKWLCEYEKYNGGDVFLVYNSTTKIIRHGRVKLLLKVGKIITLPGVLHITDLARNLISINKMSDAGVHTIFEKYKMQNGSRSNGIDEGSLEWIFVQVVGKKHH